jgi:hypothetical protein
MKSTRWIILPALLILSQISIGQDIGPVWEKQMNNQMFTSFTDVVENDDGTFTVLGIIDKKGNNSIDPWLVFFTPSGDTIKSSVFPNEGIDVPVRLAKFDNNEYLIAGLNALPGQQQTAWVLRTTADGKELWRKNHPEPSFTGRTDVAVNKDGTWWWLNTIREDNNHDVISLCLLNGEGEITGNFTFGDKQSMHAHSIRILSDQTVAITGQTEQEKGSSTMWVMRINPLGELIWKSTVPGAGKKISPECICCTPDNNLVIAGWIGSCMNPDALPENQIFDFDLILTKMDGSGKILWTKNYDREGSEGGNATTIMPDGNILVAGKCETSFTGTIGPWLLMTDKDGKKITDRVDKFMFNGDQATRVIHTSDGGLLMVGPGKTPPDSRRSIGWIRKYKSAVPVQ